MHWGKGAQTSEAMWADDELKPKAQRDIAAERLWAGAGTSSWSEGGGAGGGDPGVGERL